MADGGRRSSARESVPRQGRGGEALGEGRQWSGARAGRPGNSDREPGRD